MPLLDWAASQACWQTACNADFMGPDGTKCTPCAEGTYKDDTGSHESFLCPIHSIMAVASSLPTACVCKAGYAGANSSNCRSCATGTFKHFAGPGTCMSLKQSAIVVSLVLGLQVTVPEFNEQNQERFKQGMAGAAGVVVSNVRISKISLSPWPDAYYPKVSQLK